MVNIKPGSLYSNRTKKNYMEKKKKKREKIHDIYDGLQDYVHPHLDFPMQVVTYIYISACFITKTKPNKQEICSSFMD